MRRAVPLRRSLLVRLLATSMLIAVCAVAATAWLTVQLTTRAVTQERSRTLAADADIYDAIIEYAAGHDSWEGVDELVRRQAGLTGTRIALTTTGRQLITASFPGAPDAVAASDVPTATVDPLYLDRGIVRDASGRIDPRAVGPYRLTEQERQALHRHANDQLACLRKANISAEIVELPSGRAAVREFSDSARLGRCLPDELAIPVDTERKALADLAALVERCIERTGDVGVTYKIAPDFTVRYGDDGPSADADRALRQCAEESRREQLRPYVAPPALLFVTGPPGPESGAVRLSTANTLPIAGTALLILLLTLAVTVVVGLRLVRPLRALADAARQPADRPAPVPVTSRDEIGYLAVAFNDLSARRQALEQQRNAMVNDIAHELRTPLTNIRTWLETARDGAVDLDQEVLDLLVEESVLLHHVVNDLRDIAALEAGSLRVHPEPTYVRDLLEQVLDAHRGAGEVALRLDAAEDPEVTVDPVRLRQIVGNLVANAIRYTPPGGTVTVALEMRPGRMVISVADTGPGIAAADLPKVFDRFWRADSSRSRTTGGSGLGLPIARQLARAHGGELTATSASGCGAIFTVVLPVPSHDQESH
ncbi:sensor histidine kinase [Micromonospora sp. CA-263727]|uniref:sensor histidine kinase n=1 Tax=Micromonospora sp. CA-263727 TaxID=3239967 RepID=UPI003D8ED731